MKFRFLIALVLIVGSGSWNSVWAQVNDQLRQPLVASDVVHEEVDGLLAVEAEHFSRQTLTDQRAWYRFTTEEGPLIEPDGDPVHLGGASGGAYLEILPDTRRTHADRLIAGENFSNEPGKLALLHYRVHFNTPGRYYVWVRAFSTCGEDNGIHVGLDGEWPASGQRLQWCQGKQTWWWESKQRTQAVHCGEPHKIFLDIDKPDEHTISFSMREDGFEFDKWLMTTDREFKRPKAAGKTSKAKVGQLPKPFKLVAAKQVAKPAAKKKQAAKKLPRGKNGTGTTKVTGELKQWHKVTLDLDGPFAYEQDNKPNPFTDYRMAVRFTHESGSPSYDVPGYFAADGNAGETSAESGTVWRAHLSPDKAGRWDYEVSFTGGKQIAVSLAAKGNALAPFNGVKGQFSIAPTDKSGVDFRGKGRLQYVGERYLRFAGSGDYFLKAGPDAPETLLAYVDFDGTSARKKNAPLKTWKAHEQDWNTGDPTWQVNKGMGLIGALNYLAAKGCNVFSFLPYNVGGDGDNVWPLRSPEDKLHYDCSKLDQWQIVFDHGQKLGLFLHFKTQETENDDLIKGNDGKPQKIPAALDGGELGLERKLYYRELVARFGYELGLNWNLGEENTQSPEVQRSMAEYFQAIDPYNHLVVIHTYPQQQDKVYSELVGNQSVLTGASLQNHWNVAHQRTHKWVTESTRLGRPWVTCNDEQGPADLGVPPDPGYDGFDGKAKEKHGTYDLHDVRKKTLWGTLMAGGGGVEYYFGYKLPQNDLLCQDFRSRDQSWDYCRIALKFFDEHQIPLAEMQGADELVGNQKYDNSKYCFAKLGELYLVYLPNGGSTQLDLTSTVGSYDVQWFNPRQGGSLAAGTVAKVVGGGQVELGEAPSDSQNDWLVVVRRQQE